MARNRVIYQSEALFVGPTTGGISNGDHSQLIRVQDISHDMAATRTDVFEFGRLAPLDKVMIEPPTVTLDFSYLVTNGGNEEAMGMSISNTTTKTVKWDAGTAPALISGLIEDGSVSPGEKNYYVVTVPESEDAEGNTSSNDKTYNGFAVVGFGNAVVSNYSVNGAVGDFPSASVSAEAFNVSYISGTRGATADSWVTIAAIPSVKKGAGALEDGTAALPSPTTGNAPVFAIRPGDITLNFDSSTAGTAGAAGQLSVGGAVIPTNANEDPDAVVERRGQAEPMHIQNFSIDAPLTRTALTRLGSTFPYYRAIDFPLDITLNVSAYLADTETGSLVDLICDDQKRIIDVNMRVPCTSTSSDTVENPLTICYRLRNAQLTSQNMAATIGDTKTVDLSFQAQYGGATDTSNGLFVSGRADAS
jgi:hypothetical protein